MTRRRAVLTFDIIAGAALTALLVVAFTLAVRQFVRARDYTDAQRQLRLAAGTELSRLRAGLPEDRRPTATQPAEETPGRMILVTLRTPGTGDWSECTHVTVVARKQIRGGRWVRVELSTFLPAEEARP